MIWHFITALARILSGDAFRSNEKQAQFFFELAVVAKSYDVIRGCYFSVERCYHD